MIELVTFVQQVFEIQVDDSELLPENLDSLFRLARFIERKRGAVIGGCWRSAPPSHSAVRANRRP
jgi:hypothetical protein